MIRVIADTTCDFPQELQEKYGLERMPLTITMNGKSYEDGEIGAEEVYSAMRRGIVPRTAQISYSVLYRTFERICRAGDDILYIAFSSEMSGCFSFAKTVANELSAQYPQRRIEVVDSRAGSGGSGLIVLQALRLVQSGMDWEALLQELRFLITHLEHVFSVADLDWLVKGGRIARPVGFIGKALHLRPWLDMENGKMVVRGAVRGAQRAAEIIAQEISRRAAAFPVQLIGISHADDPEAAEELRRQILKKLPQCRTVVCNIGAVLGVHIGLGGIGAFAFTECPPHYSLMDD